MRYFRNTELAKLHDISEKTVRNWIKQANAGKLELDIYIDEKGRSYVADTTKNTLTIKDQVQENKKYRNSRTHKIVEPKQEFYKAYPDRQLYDIVNHLEKFNDFPVHYAHMGAGADISEKYLVRLRKESITNSQTFSNRLLLAKHNEIMELFGGRPINLVELGGRTGFALSDFMDYLVECEDLASYIDIDLSKDFIDRSKNNLGKKYGADFDFSGYSRDIIRERFDDILMEAGCNGSGNLVTLTGGILHAFNNKKLALSNIHESLGPDDYLVFSSKIDSDNARRYFDFDPLFGSKLLPKKDEFRLDLLNIEPSFYDVEQFYDETERQRKIQVRLKFDVTVTFKLQNGTKSLDFKKGETIMLWRFWHQTMEEMVQEFTDCGFNVVQAVKSPDEQYAMIIAKVRADKTNHR